MSSPASPDRLDRVRTHLVSLGKSEGRLVAMSQSQPVSPDVKSMLNSSRELFHDTFNEYIKIWKSLASHPDNADLTDLMKKYISEVEAFLAEPIGSSSEEMNSEIGICRLYRDIIQEHREDLLAGQASHTDLLSEYDSLDERLRQREEETNNRLAQWKEFLRCQDEFLRWLKSVEREKKLLDLPFLSLSRLVEIKRRVEVLIERCPEGERLLEVYRNSKIALGFASPEIKSSINHELGLNTARFANLQAAMKTWLDHINRVHGINQVFEDKYKLTGVLLGDIQEQFEERKIPVNFTEFTSYITFLKVLIFSTTFT